MQQHLTRALAFLRDMGQRFFVFAKKRPWASVGVFVVLVAIVSALALAGSGSSPEHAENSDNVRTVSLIPSGEYAEGAAGSQAVIGSETVVRAETSGKIIQVLPAGTRVVAGTVVAQFENSSQRAALLQAEGALEAAEAALEKTQGGLRSEKLATLQTAFESAKNGAVASLLSAYAAVDGAVRGAADQVLSNPDSNSPQVNFSSNNAQRRITLANERVSIGKILEREVAASDTLSNVSDLGEEFNVTERELRQTLSFIDTLIAALNEAIPTGDVTLASIAAYKTSATSARTALTTALSAISSARAQLETAANNLDEGLAGAEDTDLAAAAATVKQAQGSYNAARAAFNKTAVATSVSGTILSCNAAVGDVLSIGNDVCRIRAVSGGGGNAFTLPLSSVKYTPTGALVFVVNEASILETIPVETGLVTAQGITVTGLLGDEFIVHDVRGLKAGDEVQIKDSE